MDPQPAHYNQCVLTNKVVLAVLAMLLTACAPTTDFPIPSPTLAFLTATLSASVEPTRTELATTAAATPQPASIPGSTTTQVNVRQAPLASSRVLGTLAASETVQVVAREPAGNWYEIIFDAGE